MIYSTSAQEADAFWRHYIQSCRHVSSLVSIKAHGQLLELVDIVREAHTREAIRDKLRPTMPGLLYTTQNDMADASMFLAASLLSMTKVDNYDWSARHLSLHWPKDKCLRDVIEERWADVQVMGDTKVGLEKSFTALGLDRIGGLDIIWTWELANHLLLTDDNRKVHIFHGLTCLHWQLEK